MLWTFAVGSTDLFRFNWQKSIIARKRYVRVAQNQTDPNCKKTLPRTYEYAACPDCGTIVVDKDGDPVSFSAFSDKEQKNCHHCSSPRWSLIRKNNRQKSRRELMSMAMQQLPTIGPKSAEKLLACFGEDMLSNMLSDNIYEFVNLMDENGNWCFQITRLGVLNGH